MAFLTTLLLTPTMTAVPLAAAQVEPEPEAELCAQRAASYGFSWLAWYTYVVNPGNATDATVMLGVGLAVTALWFAGCTLTVG